MHKNLFMKKSITISSILISIAVVLTGVVTIVSSGAVVAQTPVIDPVVDECSVTKLPIDPVVLKIEESKTIDLANHFTLSTGCTFTSYSYDELNLPSEFSFDVSGSVLTITGLGLTLSATEESIALENDVYVDYINHLSEPRFVGIPISVTVIPLPPTCVIDSTPILGQTVTIGTQGTLDVSDYFFPENCDTPVTYTSAPTTKVTVAGLGADDATLTLDGITAGTEDITITATSGSVTAEEVFTVTIDAPTPVCAITSTTIPGQTVTIGTQGTLDVSNYFTATNCTTPVTYGSTQTDTTEVTVAGLGVNDATLTMDGSTAGTEDITITATSGSITAEEVFTVTVEAPAPSCTITSTTIPGQTVTIGTQGTLDVSSHFTATSCNTVTYTSAPTTKVTVAGLGADDATLTLDGITAGTEDITITATSGSVTAEEVFTVTIDAPTPVCSIAKTIDIPDQTVVIGTQGTLDVSNYFTAQNCSTPLTYGSTQTDTTEVTVAGLGVNDATLTMDGSTAGTEDITVTVTSGNVSAQDIFTITVEAPAPSCTITADLAKFALNYSVVRGSTRIIDVSQFFTFSTACTTSGRSYELGSSVVTKGTKGSVTSSPTTTSTDGSFTFRGVNNGYLGIPVTAKVGQTSTTQTLLLVVEAPAPSCTITSTTIPGQTVTIGTQGTLDVSSHFTATSCNTVTYTSAPTTKVTVAGLGADDATLTLDGITAGTEDITITATSGSVTAEEVFTVTIDAPTPVCAITSTTIPGQTVTIGTQGTLDVSNYFTATNCTTPVTYGSTQTDTTEVTVAGLGVNDATLTMDGSTAGTEDITITATSGSITAEEVFTVTVEKKASNKRIGVISCSIVTKNIPLQVVKVGETIDLNVKDYYTPSSDCSFNSQPLSVNDVSSFFNASLDRATLQLEGIQEGSDSTTLYLRESEKTIEWQVSVNVIAATVEVVTDQSILELRKQIEALQKQLELLEAQKKLLETTKVIEEEELCSVTKRAIDSVTLEVEESTTIDLDDYFAFSSGCSETYYSVDNWHTEFSFALNESILTIVAEGVKNNGKESSTLQQSVYLYYDNEEGIQYYTEIPITVTVAPQAREKYECVITFEGVTNNPFDYVTVGGSTIIDLNDYFTFSDRCENIAYAYDFPVHYGTGNPNDEDETYLTATLDRSILTLTGAVVGSGKVDVTAEASYIGKYKSQSETFSVDVVPSHCNISPKETSSVTLREYGSFSLDLTELFTMSEDCVLENLHYYVDNDEEHVYGKIDGDYLTLEGTKTGTGLFNVLVFETYLPGNDPVELLIDVEVLPALVCEVKERTIPAFVLALGDTLVIDLEGYLTPSEGCTDHQFTASMSNSAGTILLDGSMLTVTGTKAGPRLDGTPIYAVIHVTVSASGPALHSDILIPKYFYVEIIEAQTCSIINKGVIPDQTVTIGTPKTLDIGKYFLGSDCDDITYTSTQTDTTEVTVAGLGRNDATLTMTGNSAGTEDITITATSGDVSAQDIFTITVEAPAPVCTIVASTNIPDQTVTIGTPGTLDVSSYFTAANCNTPVTYGSTQTDTTEVTVAGLGRNDATLTMTGNSAGTEDITITATSGDVSAQDIFTITVEAPAPVCTIVASTNIPDQTVTIGTPGTLDVSSYFTAANCNTPVTYGSTQTDTTEVTVAGLGRNDATLTMTGNSAGTEDITITATSGDVSAQDIFTITVEAPAPVCTIVASTNIPDQTVTIGTPGTLDVSSYFTAANCNTPVTYGSTQTDTTEVTVAGLGRNDATLTMTGNSAGTEDITITATSGDVSAQDIFTITVEAPAPVCTITPDSSKFDLYYSIVKKNTRTIDVSQFFRFSSDCATSGHSYDLGDPVTTKRKVGTVTSTPTTTSTDGSFTFRGVKNGYLGIPVTAKVGQTSITETLLLVVDAPAPVCTIVASTNIPDQTVTIGTPGTLDVSSYFTAANCNTPVTYGSTQTDTTEVTVAGLGRNDATLTMTGNSAGTEDITITATSGDVSAQDIFTITVEAPAPVCTITPDSSKFALNYRVLRGSTRTIDVSQFFTFSSTCVTSGRSYDLGSSVVTKGTKGTVTSSPTTTSTDGSFTFRGVSNGYLGIPVTAKVGQTSITETLLLVVDAPAPVCTIVASTNIPDQTVTIGTPGTLDVSSYFTAANCNTPVTYGSTQTDTTEVTVAGLGRNDATLTMTGNSAGTEDITITATSGDVSAQDIFTITVEAPAPVCTIVASTNIPDQTVTIGTPGTLDVSSYFTAANCNTPVTYGSTQTDTTEVTVAGLGRNDATLTMTGNSAGTEDITITATSGDVSAQDIFTITVEAPAPVCTIVASTNIPDQTVTIGTPGTLDVSSYFTAANCNTPVTYGSTQTDTTEVTVAGLGRNDATLTMTGNSAGTEDITITATSGDVSAQDIFTITVEAPAPVCTIVASTNIPDQTVTIGTPGTLDVSSYFTAANCNTPVTYGSTQTDTTEVTVAGLGRNDATLTMTGNSAGTEDITITATSGDVSAQDIFTITVEAPAPVCTITASAIPNIEVLNGDSTTVDLSDYFTVANCDSPATYSVTDIDEITQRGTKSYITVSPTGVTSSGSRTFTGINPGTDAVTVVVQSGSESESQNFAVVVQPRVCTITPTGTIPNQVVWSGLTKELDVAQYFTIENCGTITYKSDVTTVPSLRITGLGAGNSRLVMEGKEKGRQTVTITARDYRPSATQTFTVTTLNVAPTLIKPLQNRKTELDEMTWNIPLNSYFRDSPRSDLTFRYVVGSGTPKVDVTIDENDVMSVTISGANGSRNITVTATDAGGLSMSDSFTVTRDYNAKPQLIRSLEDLKTTSTMKTWPRIRLSNYFNDEETRVLMYRYAIENGSGPNVVVSVLNGWMTVTVNGKNGSRKVTVTAMDAGGKEVSDTFTVMKATPACSVSVKNGGVPNRNVLKGRTLSLNFSEYFTALNCPEVTYEVVGINSRGYLSVTPSGRTTSSVTITGKKRGFDTLTVIVRNGDKEVKRDYFRVSVLELTG